MNYKNVQFICDECVCGDHCKQGVNYKTYSCELKGLGGGGHSTCLCVDLLSRETLDNCCTGKPGQLLYIIFP